MMKEVLKKYFIPHKGNNFIPHFFRAHVVSGFAAFLLLISALTVVYSTVILNNYNFLAEVLPPALVGLANTDRTAYNLPELKINPVLTLAAKYKAEDMAAKSYFAHTSPEGVTPWFWFGKAGYAFSYAGENLAVDFSESADVNNAWMNSPGHRANLLNKNFTEIGIATAKGIYQGHEATFVVQLFGTPLPAYVAPSPVPTPLPTQAPKPTPEQKVVPLPSPTPVKVAGEDVEVVSAKSDGNGLYIEVKNANAEAAAAAGGTEGPTLRDRVSGEGRRIYGIISSPATSLANLYRIIGLFVALALVIMIIVEIKVQHPRHIIYGLLLLVLIGGLIYLNQNLLSNQVLII